MKVFMDAIKTNEAIKASTSAIATGQSIWERLFITLWGFQVFFANHLAIKALLPPTISTSTPSNLTNNTDWACVELNKFIQRFLSKACQIDNDKNEKNISENGLSKLIYSPWWFGDHSKWISTLYSTCVCGYL